MDLKYGDHFRQCVRVYQPPTKAKISACCIFIHGGAWRDPSNTAADFDVFGNELSKGGIICYSVDYRLSPEIQHPEHLNDVLKALEFIHSEIKDLPCCLSGHSVGATLVLQSLQHSLPLNIKSVVLLDGIYDLPELLLEYPDYVSFITEAHKDRDWEAVTFEAEELPQTNFFLVHSTADELLSPRQTELLVKKLKRKFHFSVSSVIADFGSHNSVYQDPEVRSLLLEQLNF
ncbi:BA75_01464T0 [Komagataella pastoris]|uniref:Kynurenine formamidase n=1 Tax=Komagataella pastoris TaxID=4922 RepID=A0A1B2J8I9_PICPA|nr:BA75_01464T0 [Komagataella pastoris]